VSIFPLQPRTPHDRRFACRERTPGRATLTIETLEGRALLSHLAHPPAPDASLHAADVQGLRAPHLNHPGPVLNEIGTGYAVKVPRFYPFYTGAKRGELNAAGARAFLDAGGNLHLVGIVSGKINATPKTAAQEEFYVWGIDRGNGKAPGPYPGRPHITLDSVVVVAVRQSGITGNVRDLRTGRVLPVSPKNITIDAYDVKIVLPARLLLSTGGTPTSVPKVNFSGRTTLTGNDFHNIASFAPEGRDFPIDLSGSGPRAH